GPMKYWTSDGTQRKDANYENMLGVKELAGRGMTTEVVEEVNVIDPCFFDLNPLLLFQQKQVEFLKLVNSGDYSGAVKVASSHLDPLAARDPTSLKPLKETLVLLLTPDQAAFKTDLPLLGLASSLQVAIGKRLGIEGPQLMKIMRAMLHTYNEWFKLQKCKDSFESLLKINSLKAIPSLLPDVVYQSNTDTCTQGSSQVTVCSGCKAVEDGNSPAQVSFLLCLGLMLSTSCLSKMVTLRLLSNSHLHSGMMRGYTDFHEQIKLSSLSSSKECVPPLSYVSYQMLT
ncbi:hypothetical protein AKJ16_DCAP17995, partial [Drosera capensis]